MVDEATPIKARPKPKGAPVGVPHVAPTVLMREEEPPTAVAGRGNGSVYDDARRKAQATPGKWYLLIENAKHSGTGADAMRRRGCEITVRRNENGTYNIYAMWPTNGAAPA